MIKLYGFPISNYTNKVRAILLEKEIEFEFVRANYSRNEEFLKKSPMGLIPFIEIDGKFLSESQSIVELIEDLYPDKKPIIPKDPWEKARMTEIMHIIENYIDQPARRFYTKLVQGKEITQESVDMSLPRIHHAIEALNRLVKIAPFLSGKDFTVADSIACATFPIFTDEVIKKFLPENPLKKLNGFEKYMDFVMNRPHQIFIENERKKGIELVTKLLNRRKS